MKKKQSKKGVVCVSVGLVLTMVFVSAVLFAAPTNFPIKGTLMLPGDSSDTPVEGARISAWKFYADPPEAPPSEKKAVETNSETNGSFTLEVPVDEALQGGALNPFNKVQLRIEGTELTEKFVTVYSPFLELLNLTTPVPGVGDLKNLELSPLPLDFAKLQLENIDNLGEKYLVDQSKGIVLGIIEVADGEELVGLPGVQIGLKEFPSGNAIDGATILYMDANENWNPALKSTTMYGVFIIYNIELIEYSGLKLRDLSLATSKMDGYDLGFYAQMRVYPYDTQDGKYNMTVANYAAFKLSTPEEDGGDDGGGGSVVCFIATAALGS